MGGFLRFAAASVLAALMLAPGAGAGSGFFVGFDEDGVKWGRAQLANSIANALGTKAVRVTVAWAPGQTKVSPALDSQLDRVIVETWGKRVVVSVFGKAAETPRTDAARTEFCEFVADLMRRQPSVNDVVIWNDPNDAAFWSPQFNADGSSAAPGEYQALLARCWDAMHAVRPTANVIAASVSKGADSTQLTGGSHSAVDWFTRLGAAYRSSLRTMPIFDTVGHIPHPALSNERPWTKSVNGSIGLGDYDKLMTTLQAAFRATPQPLPGQGRVTIWYLAQGFQSVVDPRKAGLYSGVETDRGAVPAWSLTQAADTGEGTAPDQSTQIADAVRIAYCQPAVGAYFNFLLADETNLAGWQSGVLWADWTPKPSYGALKRVLAQVTARTIQCDQFAPSGAPPRQVQPPPPTQELKLADVRATSVGANGAQLAWTTTIPATVRVAYGLPDIGPTIWAAPATGQATLTGLSFDTTYRAWISAVSDDGQRATSIIDVRTKGIPQSPHATLRKTRPALLVDGHPWFFFTVWSQCPDLFTSALGAGIDFFAENPCPGGFQAQVDALRGRAFSGSVAGKPGGHGPGIVGWWHVDEPDGLDIPAEKLPGPPPGHGNMLSFLTLTNHFYSLAAPLPWPVNYKALISKADVVGFDLYPLQEWCRPERMADVFLSQREIVRMSAPRPTFQWIEATSWKCPDGLRVVTPATVIAESWLAIAGGAQGLGFFPTGWDPPIGRAIAGVARDVAKLGPALHSTRVVVTSDNRFVKAGARMHEGAVYIFAANAGFEPHRATIKVPGLGNRVLTAIDEGRRVLADKGTFTDNFARLGVHIYVAAPVGA